MEAGHQEVALRVPSCAPERDPPRAGGASGGPEDEFLPGTSRRRVRRRGQDSVCEGATVSRREQSPAWRGRVTVKPHWQRADDFIGRESWVLYWNRRLPG